MNFTRVQCFQTILCGYNIFHKIIEKVSSKSLTKKTARKNLRLTLSNVSTETAF